MRVLDTISFLLSSYIAYWLVGDQYDPIESYALFSLAAALILGFVFSQLSIYTDRRDHLFYDELVALTVGWTIVLLLTSIVFYVLKIGSDFSRIWLGVTFLGAYLLTVSIRLFNRKLNQVHYTHGNNQKHIVIVGVGKLGEEVALKMQREPWFGLVPNAFFDTSAERVGKLVTGVPVIGRIDQLAEYIEECRTNNETIIEEVWVTLNVTKTDEIIGVKNALRNTATKLHLIPNLHGLDLPNYDVELRLGLPVMDMSGLRLSHADLLLKRSIDFILASIILISLLPAMILCALVVKLESSGPIFFKQKRYGLDGREFDLWKFRSMSVEQSDGLAQASKDDSRVTRVGRLLRKYSIDELPQLINVIRGDMSLVGPRPHANEHNEYYRDKIEGYMTRHMIKPGITGWAQVNGYRGETPELEDMENRLRYDLEYIRQSSIMFDFKILVKTTWVTITAKNAH